MVGIPVNLFAQRIVNSIDLSSVVIGNVLQRLQIFDNISNDTVLNMIQTIDKPTNQRIRYINILHHAETSGPVFNRARRLGGLANNTA